MLRAISGAKKSIYLEMYIFADNTKHYNFFETLKQKAMAGVKVKIIIDSFGSLEMPSQTVEEIRASGIELLFFSYWLQRTHKKILVVDEKIAFLGGVNIHKVFRKWNDLQMRIEGPIAKSVLKSFAHTYRHCGGADPELLRHVNEKGLLNKTKLWVLENWHFKRKRFITQRYRESIINAKKSIVITTPYFAPAKWLIGELHQAVLRGVDVQVILPKETDSWMLDRVNYFYLYQMHKLGIKFYLQKEMNHAKTMIIDDTEGVIGSQNIDPLSFDYNVEIGLFFREKNMVRDIRKIVDGWKQASDIFKPFRKPLWLDYLIAPIIRVLQSIL